VPRLGESPATPDNYEIHVPLLGRDSVTASSTLGMWGAV